jgi:flavin-binding protein dodecin
MAVVKVIELLAQSPEGWEAATQEALREASMTIQGIQSVYVKEFQAVVENNQITNYRVNVKISFLVRDSERT